MESSSSPPRDPSNSEVFVPAWTDTIPLLSKNGTTPGDTLTGMTASSSVFGVPSVPLLLLLLLLPSFAAARACVAEEDADSDEPWDGFNSDAEADGDALASAGFGTDEDYGCFDSGDDDYGCEF